MPGTIHVAVLEFKGVPSSSEPSAKSLKVSMGKRQHQTWDKGDFSFPIIKIRENLVVALLDAGGNEIAHQDIQTMQIIEKGSWDEVFSINGGGHVHMKLQFTLSEEDRNRVRFMRESVMKKKLEMDPNIKLRFQEAVTPTSDSSEKIMNVEQKASAPAKGLDNIDLTSPKDESSQAGSSSAVSVSSHQMDGGLILDGAIPDATDGSLNAPSSSPVRHEIQAESPQLPDEKTETPGVKPGKEEAPPSSMFPRSTMSERGPVKKTPSSVRKMISAFESSQPQEVKTMKRAVSVPSQMNKVGKDTFLEDRLTETVVSPADFINDRGLRNLDQLASKVSGTDGEVLNESEPSQAGKELASNADDIMPRASSSREILDEGEKSAVDVMRQSPSETASSSGRIREERSQVAYELSSKSSETAAAASLKSSSMIDIQVSPKTLECYTEECHSGQSSGIWVFPDNNRRLCITTAGEQVKTHQTNKNSSEMHKNPLHEKEHKTEKKSKKIHHQPESGSASSPNDSSHGLVGQVIKIAVIVGFGVLVLLTRQKEPRNKRREEKDNLFYKQDYVDERTLKPWTGKQ